MLKYGKDAVVEFFYMTVHGDEKYQMSGGRQLCRGNQRAVDEFYSLAEEEAKSKLWEE